MLDYISNIRSTEQTTSTLVLSASFFMWKYLLRESRTQRTQHLSSLRARLLMHRLWLCVRFYHPYLICLWSLVFRFTPTFCIAMKTETFAGALDNITTTERLLNKIEKRMQKKAKRMRESVRGKNKLSHWKLCGATIEIWIFALKSYEKQSFESRRAMEKEKN